MEKETSIAKILEKEEKSVITSKLSGLGQAQSHGYLYARPTGGDLFSLLTYIRDPDPQRGFG